MTKAIDNSEDILDVRDIIERFEELESELQEAHEGEGTKAPFEEWVQAMADNDEGTLQDAAVEFLPLKALLDELCGSGGDHQWQGNWYPVSLIRDSYFVDAMKELCEDIGDMPKGFPSYIEVDWQKTADNLQVDYSSVEFDRVTYWYR